MEEFTEELKREYFSALYNLQSGNDEPMKRFSFEHNELYKVVNAMYHKRKILRENIEAMQAVNLTGLYCGSLTFNEEETIKSIPTKRKQVLRQLNKHFDTYLFVEELGEEKGRYHVHFIGSLKCGVRYTDFYNTWHSRVEMRKIISVRKAVNYLTDYVVKQVPRIRRNKRLVEIQKHCKKSSMWSRVGFSSFARQETNDALINLVFDL